MGNCKTFLDEFSLIVSACMRQRRRGRKEENAKISEGKGNHQQEWKEGGLQKLCCYFPPAQLPTREVGLGSVLSLVPKTASLLTFRKE